MDHDHEGFKYRIDGLPLISFAKLDQWKIGSAMNCLLFQLCLKTISVAFSVATQFAVAFLKKNLISRKARKSSFDLKQFVLFFFLKSYCICGWKNSCTRFDGDGESIMD